MNNAQVFYSILDEVGIDYSMGDYTDIVFNFVESEGLDSKFYEYVFKMFEGHMEEIGYQDRMDAYEDGGIFKPQKITWPKLQEYYEKGVRTAESEVSGTL